MSDARYLHIGAPFETAGTPTINNFTLNQTNDALEYLFVAPYAITISQIGLRVGTITGTTPTYIASLQGVDASGLPDGVTKGGGSPASVTFSPSGLGWSSGSFHYINLANPYTCARGEILCFVLTYSSGTVDGSNNAQFASTATTNANSYHLPRCNQVDAGVRTPQSTMPVFAYSDGSTNYGFPISALAGQTFSTGGTPEYAMKFTLPSTWASTFQVIGYRMALLLVGGHTIDFILYQGGNAGDTGTILQNWTLDTDINGGAAGRWIELYFDEVTLSTLSFGSTYRLSVKANDSTNQTLYQTTITGVEAMPGGSDFSSSTRSGGNWTDSANKLIADLILNDITAPSASGGMVVPASLYGMESVLVEA